MGDVTKWYPHVLRWEGGYANDKDDRGGETNKGITWGYFQTYAAQLNIYPITRDRLKQISDAEAKRFMDVTWFEFAKADKINNQGLAEFIADLFWAWPAGAGKMVQVVLNTNFGYKLSVDNKIGALTLQAINKTDANKLYSALDAKRRANLTAFVKANPKQAKYMRGWFNRLESLITRNKISIVQSSATGLLFFFCSLI